MGIKLKDIIVFEDDDLLVANKPAGLLVIPDRQGNKSLKCFLEGKYNEIFVVHRLDKDTSGLVVFAKNKAAHSALNTLFSSREVYKRYELIVLGEVEKDSNSIDLPILVKPNQSKSVIDHKKGKKSLTEYNVLERFKGYSHLECILHTGRMHQIRVHCAAIGHPLLIDPVYGRHTAFYLSQVKRGYKVSKGQEEQPIMDTLTLHAKELRFTHPIKREEIHIVSDLPKKMKVILKRLKDV